MGVRNRYLWERALILIIKEDVLKSFDKLPLIFCMEDEVIETYEYERDQASLKLLVPKPKNYITTIFPGKHTFYTT